VSFADRLRRATAGVGDALGIRRRPGVELVRVDPTLAPPTPTRLLALPAPELPLCRRCRTRHQPRPHPAVAGRGLAAAYGRSLLPDPTRPEPLGRSVADPRPLLRDQASAWRAGTPDPPPAPDQHLAGLREELRAPPAYWWDAVAPPPFHSCWPAGSLGRLRTGCAHTAMADGQ
jgi:hypothetical protein